MYCFTTQCIARGCTCNVGRTRSRKYIVLCRRYGYTFPPHTRMMRRNMYHIKQDIHTVKRGVCVCFFETRLLLPRRAHMGWGLSNHGLY